MKIQFRTNIFINLSTTKKKVIKLEVRVKYIIKIILSY